MIRDAPDNEPRGGRNARHGSKAVVIPVRVTPRAGKTEIAGTRDNTLLIRLAAAPVDGAANTALITLLADAIAVPKRQVTIISGEKSRTKHVKVIGVTAEQVRQRLGLSA